MDPSDLALLAAGVLLYGLVSHRLNTSVITLPLAFAGFGFAVGEGGMDLVEIPPGHGIVHWLAELTLVLLLFSDAARLNLRELVRERTAVLRMLLLGLPLAILIGAGLAWLLFPAISLPAAFLLAAILAPTDAALGQAVITSPDVPQETRQLLTAESGLNDGLALPAVVVFAVWAGAAGTGLDGPGAITVFAGKQVLLGPAVGAAVAWLGGRLVDSGIRAGRVADSFQGIAMLAIAVLAFSAAKSLGGNGFLAAFTGGVVVGCTVRRHCGKLIAFVEEEGQILILFTFLLFGAAMLPEAVAAIGPAVLLYAAGSLFLVRVLAIVLALTGSGLDGETKLFLGWFGPRGLASILFTLLILEAYPVDESAAIHACVMVTVALSILLHAVSAAPLAKAYGRRRR